MKNITALLLSVLLILSMTACGKEDSAAVKLEDIAILSEETLETLFSGMPREDIHEAWGEPDGMLSGLWGDIYKIPDSDRQIIVYYDADGLISNIKIIDQIQSK